MFIAFYRLWNRDIIIVPENDLDVNKLSRNIFFICIGWDIRFYLNKTTLFRIFVRDMWQELLTWWMDVDFVHILNEIK